MGQGKVKIEAVCVLRGNEEDVNGAHGQASVFINLILLPFVRVQNTRTRRYRAAV